MSLESVLAEVREERQQQDARWGGPEHDDRHSPWDWVAITVRHLGLAAEDGGQGVDPVRYRRQMIRVAALAVAAVEALDRTH
ncbi:MAG: hypothetical protein IT429_14890 [Gemmataceae bacterium]|nr:hypothetical protein [Gemmataceae bacterium]